MTSGARGKLRYVGAYCFAKLRHAHQEAATRRLYTLDDNNHREMTHHQAKVNLLCVVCRNENQIRTETGDADSLHETSRRQNIRQGFNHITDDAYAFIHTLTDNVIALQNSSNLSRYGENIYQYVINQLSHNRTLFNSFSIIFPAGALHLGQLEDCRECFVRELFLELVRLHARVMLKQLLKDFLAEMKRQKNLALRKRVATRQTTLLQVMQADDSSDKRHVHRRLAADTDIIHACCKRQLRTLCEAYAIPCSARDDKRALVLKLQEIPSRKGISKPDILNTSTARQQTGKRLRKDMNKCRECQQGDINEPEWIMCGRCSHWLHRSCAEIWEEDEWTSYMDTDKIFVCHYC